MRCDVGCYCIYNGINNRFERQSFVSYATNVILTSCVAHTTGVRSDGQLITK